MDDPDEALSFSRGQHAGSLGPAVVLARIVDLKDARRLLDVGGGSGAFSFTLCRRFPELARLLAQGFEGLAPADVIPGITRTITAVKQGRSSSRA